MPTRELVLPGLNLSHDGITRQLHQALDRTSDHTGEADQDYTYVLGRGHRGHREKKKKPQETNGSRTPAYQDEEAGDLRNQDDFEKRKNPDISRNEDQVPEGFDSYEEYQEYLDKEYFDSLGLDSKSDEEKE